MSLPNIEVSITYRGSDRVDTFSIPKDPGSEATDDEFFAQVYGAFWKLFRDADGSLFFQVASRMIMFERNAIERILIGLGGADGGRLSGESRRVPSKPRKHTIAMKIHAALRNADAAMNVHQLAEAMQKNGWETGSVNPSNTVRTAAVRMVERGQLVRDDNGNFSLANTREPVEIDGSDGGR